MFFDGVPQSNQPVKTPLKTNTVAATQASGPITAPGPNHPAHPPFAQNKCSACHATEMSQGLKGKLIDICLSCHSNTIGQAKFKHAPAAEGECLSCHKPHSSTNQFLLVKTGSGLCFDCHDDPTKGLAFKHSPAESGECLECHSPHGSNEEHLLLKHGQDVCYKCHDQADVIKTSSHEKIGKTDCITCHDPHAGNRKAFLKAAKDGMKTP